MKYTWPLNDSQFTSSDRKKLSSFFLNEDNRWTMASQVADFEKEMAEFVGVDYAIFVSSGSTANTLIAYYLKDKYGPHKIIFPSTTWTTSISPFIREGFEPVFVDINLEDFSLDLDKVEEVLQKDKDIKTIFITSLLGFVPDIERLKKIFLKYGVNIYMDNCENTLGKFDGKNVSSYFTSTTSTYFGHQLQSVEGGFVFTNNRDEYKYFLMARNHGMVRALPDWAQKDFLNPEVNPRFDFNVIGNNFRNSDIHALVGRLDLKRANNYTEIRQKLYEKFKSKLDKQFLLPKEFSNRTHVPFCLPIVSHNKMSNIINEVEKLGIETRPIISGNLLRQTCYKKYADYKNFTNSEFLHSNGFYIGLHPKVTNKQINEVVKFLNNYER